MSVDTVLHTVRNKALNISACVRDEVLELGIV